MGGKAAGNESVQGDLRKVAARSKAADLVCTFAFLFCIMFIQSASYSEKAQAVHTKRKPSAAMESQGEPNLEAPSTGANLKWKTQATNGGRGRCQGRARPGSVRCYDFERAPVPRSNSIMRVAAASSVIRTVGFTRRSAPSIASALCSPPEATMRWGTRCRVLTGAAITQS